MQSINLSPGSQLYVVTSKTENKGNKTATFDISVAKVTDDQRREFERSIEGHTECKKNGK